MITLTIARYRGLSLVWKSAYEVEEIGLGISCDRLLIDRQCVSLDGSISKAERKVLVGT